MHERIEGPAAWRGPQLATDRDWVHEFTPEEVREVDAALAAAKAKGRTLSDLAKEDFPIPRVAERLAFARAFLENGKGIYQLRGLRVDGRPKDELRLLYWGSDAISGPRSRKARMAISWATSAMWASISIPRRDAGTNRTRS